MSEVILHGDLAERLYEIAQRENRPVESVVKSLIESYTPTSPPEEETPFEMALHQLRPRLYQQARDYWRKTGNTDRLSLSDHDLDEQFWLIDNKGIPRLKADQGQVDLPPTPLESVAGLFDDDDHTLSDGIRETLNKHAHPRYGHPED